MSDHGSSMKGLEESAGAAGFEAKSGRNLPLESKLSSSPASRRDITWAGPLFLAVQTYANAG